LFLIKSTAIESIEKINKEERPRLFIPSLPIVRETGYEREKKTQTNRAGFKATTVIRNKMANNAVKRKTTKLSAMNEMPSRKETTIEISIFKLSDNLIPFIQCSKNVFYYS